MLTSKKTEGYNEDGKKDQVPNSSNLLFVSEWFEFYSGVNKLIFHKHTVCRINLNDFLASKYNIPFGNQGKRTQNIVPEVSQLDIAPSHITGNHASNHDINLQEQFSYLSTQVGCNPIP